MEIVEDGFWPWNALQVLWRIGADLQDPLHNGRLGGDGDRWRMAGTRAGVQRLHILGMGLAQAVQPLAHPGARHPKSGCQFLMGPVRIAFT